MFETAVQTASINSNMYFYNIMAKFTLIFESNWYSMIVLDMMKNGVCKNKLNPSIKRW